MKDKLIKFSTGSTLVGMQMSSNGIMRAFKARSFAILFLEILAFAEGISQDESKRICYMCTSQFTSECITDPGNAIPVTCKNPNDKCVVAIRGTETIRACDLELTKIPDIKKSCEGNKCNDFLYPEDRLLCHHCKNCTLVLKGSPTPCMIYKKEDKCYTDVLDNGETNRGCKSDLRKINKYTQFCSTNGCNNQPGVTKSSCISCKSSNDKNCGKIVELPSKECSIDSQSFCTQTTLLGRKNICYTYNKFGYVERGCMGKAELPEMDREFYEFCDSINNNCNNKCIKPAMKCIICNNKNKHCNENSTKIEPEICPEAINCHACKITSGAIIRGCGKPNNATMFDKCHYCQESDGCNNQNFLTCFKCDSKTDQNCAQWTNPEKISLEMCTTPSAECGVKIEGVHTIRGCFLPEELACKEGDQKCLRCNKNLCNSGIIPKNRKRCHICSKTKECAQTQNPENAVVCPKYQENDQCIFYADSYNEMIRTCSSDLDELNKCKEALALRCKQCKDDGCNGTPLMLEPTLTCIKCKGPKCAWGQKIDAASKCINKFPYYLPESCITQIVDGEIERGCTFDVGTCSETGCKMCYTEACNVQTRSTQECIQCNSSRKNETSCAASAEGIHAQVCMYPSILYEHRGCYTKRQGEVVIRGCAVGLTAKELEYCKRDNVSCHYCEGNSCNSEKVPMPSSTYTMMPVQSVFFTIYIITQFIF